MFSVKKGLEIRFNDVLDRKQTFLTIRRKFFSPKNGIFPKGLTYAFGQKWFFFSLFVFGEKGLEIRFDDVLGRKTFFGFKNKIFQCLKNGIFPEGLTQAFGHYLFSLKIRLEVGLDNFLDRKKLEIVLTDF